jgi:hypothetical protein
MKKGKFGGITAEKQQWYYILCLFKIMTDKKMRKEAMTAANRPQKHDPQTQYKIKKTTHLDRQCSASSKPYRTFHNMMTNIVNVSIVSHI